MGSAPPGERGPIAGSVTTRTQDRRTATDPLASSSEPVDDGPHNVHNERVMARQGDERHQMGTASPGKRSLLAGSVTTRTQDRETAPDLPASPPEPADEGPHNVNNVVLGTALLWIGWFGFNGGSALGGNLRAVSACTSTHVAACAGGSANLLIFWFQNSMAQRFPAMDHDPDTYRTPSVILFCDGAVIALVAITPAAGYVRLRRKTCNPRFADRVRFLFGAPQSSVWYPASLSFG
jgi:hypothetical protein